MDRRRFFGVCGVMERYEPRLELAQVLSRGGEQELIPGTARATQAQPVEAEDALQMRKLHRDLLRSRRDCA